MGARCINSRSEGGHIKHFKVNLLSSRFLENKAFLREFSYWLDVMKRPQGWHYDIDETWILENLERAQLPAGATILDAGAGLGAMQYILAARGYNVVSLDFGKRAIPKESLGIFDITLSDQDRLEYQHTYQEYMAFANQSVVLDRTKRVRSILGKAVERDALLRGCYKIKREMRHRFFRGIEKLRAKKRYGGITFERAAFHDIPFGENVFDAVISVSALEHADIKLLDRNLSELVRVAKPGAPILITTSAADGEEDVFDDITQGWCFSSVTMSNLDKDAQLEYSKYKQIEKEIMNSETWRSRLDPYYFLDRHGHFYGKKMLRLPYLPLGLSMTK